VKFYRGFKGRCFSKEQSVLEVFGKSEKESLL
jgi:hypothetical protein